MPKLAFAKQDSPEPIQNGDRFLQQNEPTRLFDRQMAQQNGQVALFARRIEVRRQFGSNIFHQLLVTGNAGLKFKHDFGVPEGVFRAI